MNIKWRIGIIVALLIAVGAVMAAKYTASPGAEDVASSAPQRIAGVPTLLDLGATQCIPCKMMAPVLDELAIQLKGKLNVQFIDVWENPDAGKPFGIQGIPTQIFYDASGRELSRHEGFISKQDIINRFKEHGIELALGQLPVQ